MNNTFFVRYCDQDLVKSLKMRHYGSKRFDASIFNTVEEIPFHSYLKKPSGGLYTAVLTGVPGNAWKDFALGELEMSRKYFSTFFDLTFRPYSRVAVIDSLDDLLQLPRIPNNHGFVVDWKLLSNLADAIWLTRNGEHKTRLTKPMELTGWDCETVLILKQESIIFF